MPDRSGDGLAARSATEEEAIDDFIDLSVRLTGVERLDRATAVEYIQRIRGQPFGQQFAGLIDEYRSIRSAGGDIDAAIARRILSVEPLSALARRVTLLWYTSAFENAGQWQFGTPSQHFGALMWPIIGAHPLALSGGYFGYWKYPPES